MKVQVCTGNTCSERYSSYILERLENDQKKINRKNLSIENCMCIGECKKGPNMVVDGKVNNGMNPIKASKLIFNGK